MENLKKTPLFEAHQDLKAQMAAFGDYLMPIQYDGILKEHGYCRNAVAVFDICHMGEFRFQGDLESSGIEKAISFSLAKIAVGKCKYGFLLNEEGKIVDDLIAYKLSQDELMIVVNSATTQKDFDYIGSQLKGDYEWSDISQNTAKLDVQGPLSREVLTGIFGSEIEQIPYFGFRTFTDSTGQKLLISRTGYTGELGYEVYSESEYGKKVWAELLKDSRMKPAGLGARDILRLEMGYSLYGSDIDECVTPIEAGLEVFVDFNKDFVGKVVLEKQRETGVGVKKIAFTTHSRRAPRHDYAIVYGDNKVGRVTSGVFSPMLSCGIGMGYIQSDLSALGTKITIQHENIEIEAEVVQTPFYHGGSLRK